MVKEKIDWDGFKKEISGIRFEDNEDFVAEWSSSVASLLNARGTGLAALEEFADITKACADDWLCNHVMEATSNDHKFDICMCVNTSA